MMRWSKAFIPTLKEVPSDAEVPSHILMIRAGVIRKVAAGTYTYLPFGLRALKKAEAIVREEMNRAGAQELLFPAIAPLSLLIETGRLDDFGETLIRFTDRHNKENYFAPTHEEVITDLVRNEIQSYRQLPITLYQIQTKFRDEPRPRAGIIRSCEFLMKDAYSFDRDKAGLDASYKAMFEAYCRIFARSGLKFAAVEADTGAMGGDLSHEFMALVPSGEDRVASCAKCGYAANLECAKSLKPEKEGVPPLEKLEVVDTPGAKTIDKVTAFLKVGAALLMKTMIYEDKDGKPFAVLVNGADEVNETKLSKVFPGAKMADPALVEEATGSPLGFAGPVGIKIPIYADCATVNMANFITGANQPDRHAKGVNFGRDFKVTAFIDARAAREGDPCPKCGAPLALVNGIELGHVFKLGTKYSEAMKALYQDEKGDKHPLIMGCYGIGVNRIIAAAIEVAHDEDGIIWPMSIAPYQALMSLLDTDAPDVAKVAEKICGELDAAGVEVLLDDRPLRPGVKFKDADLIGIPVRVTVGARGLKEGLVEIRERAKKETVKVKPDEAAGMVEKIVTSELSRLGRESVR